MADRSDISSEQQTLTLQEALDLGVQHHNAGDLPKAEGIYNQILEADPDQPVALHLLGMIAHQTGNNEKAVELIEKALTLKPDYAEAHNNLGVVQENWGKLDDAGASYQKAVDFNPNYTEAHFNLGHIYQQRGALGDAINQYRRVLTLAPDFAMAHNNLGNIYKDQGQQNDAVTHYREAIAHKPDLVLAHNNLGVVLQELGRFDDAITSIQKALALKPDYTEALNNLGTTYQALGNPDEAKSNFQKALTLKPDYPEAHNNLGGILEQSGNLDDAVSHFQQALILRPDYYEVHYNLGNVHRSLGRLDDSLTSCKKAIELKPDFADAHNNLAVAFQETGNLDEAEKSYRKALELKPDYWKAQCNLLYTEQYRPRHTVETLYKLHEEWDSAHGRVFRKVWPEHVNNPNPDRRLRIGFVSADLRRHPVGYFTVGMFENLPKEEIQIFVYADHRGDELTERIRAATDIWHYVRGISDEKLVAMILDDEIDILVDLSGHTARNRLLVFARKPAPVQVTWAGYVGTTGLSAIDYLLSDKYSILPDEERYCSEKTIRMPDSYVCYDAPKYAPEVGPLPLRRNGGVTFGSFSNPAKLNTEVISVWSRILERVPNSKLLMKYRGVDSTTNVERLSDIFEANGINQARLKFEGNSPHTEMLSRYNDVDIGLDTFPYSGGLTTCEALWMGVPVVTVPGETFASRHSLSHLSTVGLPELVACDQDDYVRLVSELALNADRLEELRSGLRKKMANSPICDSKKFGKGFSTIMREIWSDWCLSQERGGSVTL